jgi:hypothetical protein
MHVWVCSTVKCSMINPMYICKVYEQNAVPCETHESLPKAIWCMLGGGWFGYSGLLCVSFGS